MYENLFRDDIAYFGCIRILVVYTLAAESCSSLFRDNIAREIEASETVSGFM
jgi:hypothetical protein